MQHLAIPVIDMHSLDDSTGERMRLATACSEWGFFQVVNHGIDPSERDRFLRAAVDFFALPREQKRRISRTATNPLGYFDSELTKNRRDWKEIFDFGRDPADESGVSSQWPALPEFRATMLDWFGRCEMLSFDLLGQICGTLGVARDLLHAHFSPRNSSFLRLNHYPLCAEPADPSQDDPSEGHLGIHHHTDAGALTVLVQDDVAGLQVRYADHWHTVTPEPGGFIINIGDLMQVWSNGRYRAPTHRVLANNTLERFSAPFFFNPTLDTICTPLVDDTPHYRPVKWGDFRAARAAGDYADLGEEIQISDFLIAPD